MMTTMTPMVARVLLISLVFLSELSAQSSLNGLDVPASCSQIIWVQSANNNATTGQLVRYERVESEWEQVGTPIPVVLGKNGLAWGKGLHESRQPEKVEGDGKAPAGIFLLGTSFGYAETSLIETSYPYRQATDRDYFIDDSQSEDYNSWKSIPLNQANNPKAFWTSYERMRRKDHLYEFGIVVKHNQSPAVPGKGSAIFLHVWRGPGSATLGCTAMSKENLLALAAWLEPGKSPVLIQISKSDLPNLKWN
ncbi:L,D-transpeptidase family protein [Reichenbachiella ulvae]|uniref:L,D-transpeptidase family protein n=1 Tax=Reichenbachiella ulvae TaxID=2980104 RepID=A0ABT3CQF0_9BACT|nr:L,D-transpeptidase family protein [Reichenbachiella ulvae]MCV9385847.1 L,D-transpeptidase family protein [Reichenbachiella ulvae]